ncbi:translation initiation factor eIF3 subunit g, variant 2 [Aspergillus wentii]
MKDQLKDKKVKCRICSGEHFTARCPFKDTMAPVDEGGAAAEGGAEEPAAGGLGTGTSSYVPPHLRKGAASGGERMGGKYEKDDLATLRVTNVSVAACCSKIFLYIYDLWLTQFFFSPRQVSELAEEQELRDLFERFGRVTRVFLARDRETQRAKGFAFISFADRDDAARACEKVDGCMFLSQSVAQLQPKNANTLVSLSSRLPPPYSPRRVRKENHLKNISFASLVFFLRHDTLDSFLFVRRA